MTEACTFYALLQMEDMIQNIDLKLYLFIDIQS